MRNPGISLRLYIAPDTMASNRAIANLHRLCEALLDAPTRVEIIDVIADPALAENAGITRAPTLVRNGIGRLRQVEGELADLSVVAERLGLPIRPNRALA